MIWLPLLLVLTLPGEVGCYHYTNEQRNIFPPKTGYRILVLGDSTVFGVDNPSDQTWPHLLGEQLGVEVLNGGIPGGVIGPVVRDGHPDEYDLIRHAKRWIAETDPDLVLLYAGYNNAPRNESQNAYFKIYRFHTETWLGRLLRPLYNRSMIYTAVLEKLHFGWLSKGNPLKVERKRFAEDFKRLVEAISVPLIVVLQATQSIDSPAQTFTDDMMFLSYELGITPINPRPYLDNHPDAESFWCDDIHLTNARNQVLADYLAEVL